MDKHHIRNRLSDMKGIVFTLDAIFALAIASFAISILVYLQFYSQVPMGTSYLQASNLFQTLSATNVSELASSNLTAQDIFNTSIAQNDTWSMQSENNQNDGFSNHGPMSPNIAFIYSNYTADSGISAAAIAAYGRVYIATANSLNLPGIFAVNATTGTRSWSSISIGKTYIQSMLALPDGSIALLNNTYITKRNALNGNVIWSSSFAAYGTNPQEAIYSNGKIIIALYSGNILVYSQTNGTELSYANHALVAPRWIGFAGGSLIVSTGSKVYAYDMEGNNISSSSIWSSAIGTWAGSGGFATYDNYIGL